MSAFPNIHAARGRCRHRYHVEIIGPGCQFLTWPGFEIRSNVGIRAFTIDYFQRWFGRVPDDRRRSWFAKGFMAEAVCRRGYRVEVQQINYKVLPRVRAPRYRDSRALMVVNQGRAA